MGTLDVIILALILIPGIWQGLKNGLTRQVVALAGIFAGVFLAGKFGPDFSGWISGIVSWKPVVCRITAFALIFIAAYLVFLLIGVALQKILKEVFGEWLNRLLGVVFGIAKFALLAGLLVMAFDSLNGKMGLVDSGTLGSSPVYSALREGIKVVFPYLKELLGKGGIV